ncbi:MAG TPA: hypothetical protein VMT20_15145 [Terriglobia bacterium]|nr:hypothetical protein [Terriglobia bacterium]
MTDMLSILNTPGTQIEAPKSAPPGWYVARLVSVDTSGKQKTKNGNDQIIFDYQLEQGIEIDPEALQGIELPIKIRSWQVVTDKSAYRIRQLVEDHFKVDLTSATLGEGLQQAVGRLLRVQVTHDLSSNPPRVNINQTAPLED